MVFFKAISIRSRLMHKSLLVLAALGLMLPGASTAQSARTAQPASQLASKSIQAAESAPTSRAALPDGTYLFGQSEQPDQMGSAYAVFSVQNGQTVGAFYQPHSSFDCFSGHLQSDRLAVNVVDSYEQTVHPYEIALTLTDSLVAGDAAGAYTLSGFYRIDTLSQQDLDILAVCEADFAQ
ncbi:MAG: hypothetical protein AAFP07_19355 [Cyanobacteria bacterium J06606_4]